MVKKEKIYTIIIGTDPLTLGIMPAPTKMIAIDVVAVAFWSNAVATIPTVRAENGFASKKPITLPPWIA